MKRQAKKIWRRVRANVRATHLQHELWVALLLVLVDGAVRAAQEANYLGSAVKVGSVLGLIALGIDFTE